MKNFFIEYQTLISPTFLLIATTIAIFYNATNKEQQGIKQITTAGLIVIILTIIGIIFSYITTKNTINETKVSKNETKIANSMITKIYKSDSLKTIENDSLNYEIRNIRLSLLIKQKQYDSLLNLIIANNTNLKSLENTTNSGFKNSDELIKSIKTKEVLRKRILTNEQKSIMVNVLKQIKKQSIDVFYLVMNSGSKEYAKYFIDVFEKAGWNPSLDAELGGYPEQDTNEIAIVVKFYGPFNKQLDVMKDAFTQAKLNYQIAKQPDLNLKGITLYIK